MTTLARPYTARQLDAARHWARAGGDPNDAAVAALIERGAPPIRGGAVGSGPGATFVNGPAPGFTIDPQLFNDRTVLNTFQMASKAFPGFGQQVTFDLPKRGLIALVELVTNITFAQTHGTGTDVLADYAKALSLYSNVQLLVDGSPLVNAHAAALQARLQAASKNAPQTQDAIPWTNSTTGNYVWETHTIIPVAYDQNSLHGALFSQSDSLYAQLVLTAEAQANLFTITGNDTLAINAGATITPYVYTYDVPFVDQPKQGQVGVLPNLDVVHRIMEYSVPVVGNGDTQLYLPEIPGQLQRLFCWIDNTAGALIDPASWSGIRFTYAETETPQNFNPISTLLTRNAREYNGRVGAYNPVMPWNAGGNIPKVAVFDFASSNARNALYPANVTRPLVTVTLPTTITPNAGARFYVVAEWLEGVI